MKRRGFTLIEMMIVVAMLGIASALSGINGVRAQSVAIAELQRERALLLLDEMDARQTRPDVVCFNASIASCAKGGRPSASSWPT